MRHKSTKAHYFTPWVRCLVKIAIASALLAAFVWTATGCNSTVIPKPVASQTVAFSGNDMNAGILRLDSSGALITPRVRDYYNGLIEIYGRGSDAYPIIPALRKDAGLSKVAGADHQFPEYKTLYFMDREHVAWLSVMSKWRKAGRLPAKD